MAKSKENDLMQGASGRVGKMLVFSQRAGETIINRKTKKARTSFSEKQNEVKERFLEAAYYAKSAMEDPEKKALYHAKAKPGQTAYNMALSDYLKAPELKTVFRENYMGITGDIIKLRVIDNFEVKSVKITLEDDSGALIEEGQAVQHANRMDWIYTVSVDNPDLESCRLIVNITDTPGNVTVVKQDI